MTTIRTATALPVDLIAAPLFADTAGFNEGTRNHHLSALIGPDAAALDKTSMDEIGAVITNHLGATL